MASSSVNPVVTPAMIMEQVLTLHFLVERVTKELQKLNAKVDGLISGNVPGQQLHLI